MSEDMFWAQYDPSAEDVYNASIAIDMDVEFAELAASSFGDYGGGLNRARAHHMEAMQSESLKYAHTEVLESRGLFARIVDAVLNR